MDHDDFAELAPAARRIAWQLSSDWRVCSRIVGPARSPTPRRIRPFRQHRSCCRPSPPGCSGGPAAFRRGNDLSAIKWAPAWKVPVDLTAATPRLNLRRVTGSQTYRAARRAERRVVQQEVQLHELGEAVNFPLMSVRSGDDLPAAGTALGGRRGFLSRAVRRVPGIVTTCPCRPSRTWTSQDRGPTFRSCTGTT